MMYKTPPCKITDNNEFLFVSTRGGKEKAYVSFEIILESLRQSGIKHGDFLRHYSMALEELAQYNKDNK